MHINLLCHSSGLQLYLRCHFPETLFSCVDVALSNPQIAATVQRAPISHVNEAAAAVEVRIRTSNQIYSMQKAPRILELVL